MKKITLNLIVEDYIKEKDLLNMIEYTISKWGFVDLDDGSASHEISCLDHKSSEYIIRRT